MSGMTALRITYTLDDHELSNGDHVDVDVPAQYGAGGVLKRHYDYAWGARRVAERLSVHVSRVQVHDIDNIG